jgi:hypothetical protein
VLAKTLPERYRTKFAVDLDAPAEMSPVIPGGGIILSKVVRDTRALPLQVVPRRSFVRGIFLGV